jgi:hypothetical protein
MWEPQPLTTLRASKACRGENFLTFCRLCLLPGNICTNILHTSHIEYWTGTEYISRMPFLLRFKHEIASGKLRGDLLYFSLFSTTISLCFSLRIETTFHTNRRQEVKIFCNFIIFLCLSCWGRWTCTPGPMKRIWNQFCLCSVSLPHGLSEQGFPFLFALTFNEMSVGSVRALVADVCTVDSRVVGYVGLSATRPPNGLEAIWSLFYLIHPFKMTSWP